MTDVMQCELEQRKRKVCSHSPGGLGVFLRRWRWWECSLWGPTSETSGWCDTAIQRFFPLLWQVCVYWHAAVSVSESAEKHFILSEMSTMLFSKVVLGGKWAVVSGWNWGETRSKINWNTYRSNKQATRHFKVALRCFFPPYFLTYTLTGHLLNFLLIQISHQPYTWKQLSALGHVDVVLVFHIQWACCHCIPCFLMYCSQRQGQKPSQIFRDPNSFFSSRNTCNFPSIFHTSCV